MKKLIFVILFIAVSGPSFAGYKWYNGVSIGSNNFQGTLGYTRNTADNVQYIGCRDYGTSIYCSARNTAGATKSCSSSNANHIAAIRGLNGDGNLYASVHADGSCTTIIVRHTSQDAPK